MGDTKINYDEQFGMNTFRHEICAALGEAFWKTLTDGLTLQEIETEGACQCTNMCAFMKRFPFLRKKLYDICRWMKVKEEILWGYQYACGRFVS